MPSPLNQFTPDKQHADGFTLIEIVMVLVLLGILSAVAVPKYFDLQEEAIAKKCQHNRGVVQSSVITQYAAAQLEGTADSFKGDGWKTKIDSVLQDLGGTDCTTNDCASPKLCEAGGHYKVEFNQTDGNLVVTVTCDWPGHGSTADNSTTNPSNVFFGRSESDFAAWLKENYDNLLDSTFTESSGGNRDAFIDGLSDKIREKLIADGYDLSKSVLLIQRKDYGLFDDDGNRISENGSVPDGVDIRKLHWKAELFITVASTDGLVDGGTVKGTSYSMTLDYNKKGSADEKKVNDYGPFHRNDSIGSVECTVKAAGKDKDGNNLFTIEPL